MFYRNYFNHNHNYHHLHNCVPHSMARVLAVALFSAGRDRCGSHVINLYDVMDISSALI